MEPTLDELDIYTETLLASRLGVRKATVQKWRRIGRLTPTGYTPGGRPVYSLDYVRELLHNDTPEWMTEKNTDTRNKSQGAK